MKNFLLTIFFFLNLSGKENFTLQIANQSSLEGISYSSNHLEVEGFFNYATTQKYNFFAHAKKQIDHYSFTAGAETKPLIKDLALQTSFFLYANSDLKSFLSNFIIGLTTNKKNYYAWINIHIPLFKTTVKLNENEVNNLNKSGEDSYERVNTNTKTFVNNLKGIDVGLFYKASEKTSYRGEFLFSLINGKYKAAALAEVEMRLSKRIFFTGKIESNTDGESKIGVVFRFKNNDHNKSLKIWSGQKFHLYQTVKVTTTSYNEVGKVMNLTNNDVSDIPSLSFSRNQALDYYSNGSKSITHFIGHDLKLFTTITQKQKEAIAKEIKDFGEKQLSRLLQPDSVYVKNLDKDELRNLNQESGLKIHGKVVTTPHPLSTTNDNVKKQALEAIKSRDEYPAQAAYLDDIKKMLSIKRFLESKVSSSLSSDLKSGHLLGNINSLKNKILTYEIYEVLLNAQALQDDDGERNTEKTELLQKLFHKIYDVLTKEKRSNIGLVDEEFREGTSAVSILIKNMDDTENLHRLINVFKKSVIDDFGNWQRERLSPLTSSIINQERKLTQSVSTAREENFSSGHQYNDFDSFIQSMRLRQYVINLQVAFLDFLDRNTLNESEAKLEEYKNSFIKNAENNLQQPILANARTMLGLFVEVLKDKAISDGEKKVLYESLDNSSLNTSELKFGLSYLSTKSENDHFEVSITQEQFEEAVMLNKVISKDLYDKIKSISQSDEDTQITFISILEEFTKRNDLLNKIGTLDNTSFIKNSELFVSDGDGTTDQAHLFRTEKTTHINQLVSNQKDNLYAARYNFVRDHFQDDKDSLNGSIDDYHQALLTSLLSDGFISLEGDDTKNIKPYFKSIINGAYNKYKAFIDKLVVEKEKVSPEFNGYICEQFLLQLLPKERKIIQDAIEHLESCVEISKLTKEAIFPEAYAASLNSYLESVLEAIEQKILVFKEQNYSLLSQKSVLLLRKAATASGVFDANKDFDEMVKNNKLNNFQLVTSFLQFLGEKENLEDPDKFPVHNGRVIAVMMFYAKKLYKDNKEQQETLIKYLELERKHMQSHHPLMKRHKESYLAFAAEAVENYPYELYKKEVDAFKSEKNKDIIKRKLRATLIKAQCFFELFGEKENEEETTKQKDEIKQEQESINAFNNLIRLENYQPNTEYTPSASDLLLLNEFNKIVDDEDYSFILAQIAFKTTPKKDASTKLKIGQAFKAFNEAKDIYTNPENIQYLNSRNAFDALKPQIHPENIESISNNTLLLHFLINRSKLTKKVEADSIERDSILNSALVSYKVQFGLGDDYKLENFCKDVFSIKQSISAYETEEDFLGKPRDVENRLLRGVYIGDHGRTQQIIALLKDDKFYYAINAYTSSANFFDIACRSLFHDANLEFSKINVKEINSLIRIMCGEKGHEQPNKDAYVHVALLDIIVKHRLSDSPNSYKKRVSQVRKSNFKEYVECISKLKMGDIARHIPFNISESILKSSFYKIITMSGIDYGTFIKNRRELSDLLSELNKTDSVTANLIRKFLDGAELTSDEAILKLGGFDSIIPVGSIQQLLNTDETTISFSTKSEFISEKIKALKKAKTLASPAKELFAAFVDIGNADVKEEPQIVDIEYAIDESKNRMDELAPAVQESIIHSLRQQRNLDDFEKHEDFSYSAKSIDSYGALHIHYSIEPTQVTIPMQEDDEYYKLIEFDNGHHINYELDKINPGNATQGDYSAIFTDDSYITVLKVTNKDGKTYYKYIVNLNSQVIRGIKDVINEETPIEQALGIMNRSNHILLKKVAHLMLINGND